MAGTELSMQVTLDTNSACHQLVHCMWLWSGDDLKYPVNSSYMKIDF